MIRSPILLAALTLVVLPATAMAQIAPCRGPAVVRPDPAPLAAAPPNNAGCDRGVPLRVPGADLFRCQVVPAEGQDDIPEGSPEYVILLDRPGRPRLVLPDDLMAGRFHDFEVLAAELDGDRKTEWVLAAWNSQGNGLGVNRWTVRVFDHDWNSLAVYDDVSDWGDSSVVAAPAGRPGCDLAITTFVDDVDSRGRPGIAFQARFYRLTEDGMIEATDRPTLTRRYTFAFQDQRTAHFRAADEPIRGDVAAWLSHPSTRAVR